MKTINTFFLLSMISILLLSCGHQKNPYSGKNYFVDDTYLEENYSKSNHRIEMRDGIKLHTIVYEPNDTSVEYPILLLRTPYSIGPYGDSTGYYGHRRYAWNHYIKEHYIIVYQDVRGRFMSEGEYVNMTPHLEEKSGKSDIDESSDTFDTIDWLVKNIPNNNGNVGLWGISYPGFYASAGVIDAHPALKAVSPQAPIADWFNGDDWHHNGAFNLAASYGFMFQFGAVRDGLVDSWPPPYVFPTDDGYEYMLKLGPLKNANENYYKDEIPFWKEMMAHGNYDDYWKGKNILPHLKSIKPATLVVGGWFDAENLNGALKTYKSIEANSPSGNNRLVMGPWYHGGWVRSAGDSLGDIYFESKTRDFYAENIVLPFFDYHLKGKGDLKIPEASIFITGSNKWTQFDVWPPEGLTETPLYLAANGKLSYDSPIESDANYVEYTSDPSNPVPFTKQITTEVPKPYMVEDQSFVADREDVIVFETEILEEDFTVLGEIGVDLFLSTSGTDSDFIVKVIDVIPGEEMNREEDYQMMLRGDIFRAKFRNSFETPEPMIPGEVTNLKFDLHDVAHTFKKGHKIMVQIQSSWFPLFDRNPQKFVDIYSADESDFQKATQRIFFSKSAPSKIIFRKAD